MYLFNKKSMGESTGITEGNFARVNTGQLLFEPVPLFLLLLLYGTLPFVVFISALSASPLVRQR